VLSASRPDPHEGGHRPSVSPVQEATARPAAFSTFPRICGQRLEHAARDFSTTSKALVASMSGFFLDRCRAQSGLDPTWDAPLLPPPLSHPK